MMATAAVIVYALLWLAYAQHWGWLQAVDDAVVQPLYDYGVKHPGWVQFWDVLCTVFSPAAFRLVGAAIVVLAVFRRNLRVILFILTAIGMSGIVTQIAKGLADRPRPITALAAASSSAFPSGHALGVMAAVLALLTISAGMFNRCGRAASIVFGAVVVIAVGVGRVVLNVHHPSDVLAGWALGYLWFLACLLAIRPLPLAAAAAPEAEPIGAAADETPQARGI